MLAVPEVLAHVQRYGKKRWTRGRIPAAPCNSLLALAESSASRRARSTVPPSPAAQPSLPHVACIRHHARPPRNVLCRSPARWLDASVQRVHPQRTAPGVVAEGAQLHRCSRGHVARSTPIRALGSPVSRSHARSRATIPATAGGSTLSLARASRVCLRVSPRALLWACIPPVAIGGTHECPAAAGRRGRQHHLAPHLLLISPGRSCCTCSTPLEATLGASRTRARSQVTTPMLSIPTGGRAPTSLHVAHAKLHPIVKATSGCLS